MITPMSGSSLLGVEAVVLEVRPVVWVEVGVKYCWKVVLTNLAMRFEQQYVNTSNLAIVKIKKYRNKI